MVLSFTEIFHNFASILSNSSAEYLFYVGKGYTFTAEDISRVIWLWFQHRLELFSEQISVNFRTCDTSIYRLFGDISVILGICSGNNSIKLIMANGKKSQYDTFVFLPQWFQVVCFRPQSASASTSFCTLYILKMCTHLYYRLF